LKTADKIAKQLKYYQIAMYHTMVTYLYNQIKKFFLDLSSFIIMIIKARTSGMYNSGTKKYVRVSLGGRGFSVADDILL